MISCRTAKTVIELPVPLDLAASADLLRAFDSYSQMEKDLWQQVGQDLVRGQPPRVESVGFQETFVVTPQGGKLPDDVLQ